jgi:UDP-N-acetylglucosamine 4,6-dehydratase (inverting)
MNKDFLKNKSVLITGGTGSFGHAFVGRILKMKAKVKRLIIFSRDELKQYNMEKIYSERKYPQIRYFIGDVRDKDRLSRAFNNVDIVVHAAALKHVPKGESDPIEFIKTNIYGAQNVIEASLANKVKKVIALSTDKASSPINLYGATKLCSDKLFVAANNVKGSLNILFSIVRYGNVFGSRGSIVPYFIQQKKNRLLTITHKDMTRFNINLEDSVNMVLWAIKNAKGKEIFVPKLPSYKVLDLARTICSKSKIKFIGIRAGEKIHEDMITEHDALNTVDLGKYYAVLPDQQSILQKYKNAKKVSSNFSLNSGNNKNFLSIEKLKKEIDRLTRTLSFK